MQNYESVLDQVCSMSVYDPRREKTVAELVQDKHLYEEDERFWQLANEAEEADLSPVFMHRSVCGSDLAVWCDYGQVLKLRRQLCRFYADLRSCQPYSLQDIVESFLKAEEGSVNFWKWHAYLEFYIENNKVDTKEMVDVCKKCLLAEKKFCQSLGKLGGLPGEIVAFSPTEGGQPFGVETMKLHFIGADVKTAPSKVPSEILFANRFLYQFSVEEVFALWQKDNEVIQAVGNDVCERCRQWVADYFCEISDEDLCFDYLDVSINNALNSAAEGVDLTEIEARLDKVEQELSGFVNYRKEIKVGIAVALKACRQFTG